MRPFWIALQFLTRLPVRLDRTPDAPAIGRSLPFYPLVGLLLGAVLATLAWRLADQPPLLTAALVLVAWVALTGAMHLDGLADSCDAWVGGQGDAARTLAIMKDPRSGPMGVTAVVLVLLVKFAALSTLINTEVSTAALLLTPVVGRGVLPALFLCTPYVRRDGLGAPLAAHAPTKATVVGLVIASLLTAVVGGASGVWAVLTGLAVLWLARRAMLRRVGGTTGDTAGALVELTEVSVLVVVALQL